MTPLEFKSLLPIDFPKTPGKQKKVGIRIFCKKGGDAINIKGIL